MGQWWQMKKLQLGGGLQWQRNGFSLDMLNMQTGLCAGDAKCADTGYYLDALHSKRAGDLEIQVWC